MFPVVLVELNDGREVYIEVDSSTTANELCVDAADEMGTNHNAGYGIQIGMMGKVSSIEKHFASSNSHVCSAPARTPAMVPTPLKSTINMA